MNNKYTTYKRDGRFFIGVYCLNDERGQAVKDAAEARKEKIHKEKKPELTKKSAVKLLTRKNAKTAPATTAA